MIYLDVNFYKSILLNFFMNCSKISNVLVFCRWINNWVRFCCLFGERFNFMISLNIVIFIKFRFGLVRI